MARVDSALAAELAQPDRTRAVCATLVVTEAVQETVYMEGGFARPGLRRLAPLDAASLEPLVTRLIARVVAETGLTPSEVILETGRFTVTAPARFIAVLIAQPEIASARAPVAQAAVEALAL